MWRGSSDLGEFFSTLKNLPFLSCYGIYIDVHLFGDALCYIIRIFNCFSGKFIASALERTDDIFLSFANDCNAVDWFTHLVLAILLALIALFFRVSVQKITGFAFGFNSTFMLWWAGLIISLVLVFISQGYVPILLPGGIAMAMMVRHRLGEFRYGF